MNTLVFWQNIPSIHQAPLVREIANIWLGDVLVVTESEVSEERLEQGWYLPDFFPARLIMAPSARVREQIIYNTKTSDCVHIFTGFHAYPEIYKVFKLMIQTDAIVGVFAEPAQIGNFFLTTLRFLLYKMHSFRWGKNIEFLLATGAIGVNWYKTVGFRQKAIYPFGYFVAHNKNNSYFLDDCLYKNKIRFLFVGQLIPRKGVDLMLKALAINNNLSWILDVVGSGNLIESYKKYAKSLGILEKIFWYNFESNDCVRSRMINADILVLPSRFDGWGVVVNEALLAGTRVIVSDACGASDLVVHKWQGTVFKSRSIESLAFAFSDEIGKGRQTDDMRKKIHNWACRSIDPKVIAKYFLGIIAHARDKKSSEEDQPVPPWRDKIE